MIKFQTLEMDNNNKFYITNFTWGEITVNNTLKFKDIILCSDGRFIQEWNWNIFRTRHCGINIREFDYIISYPNVTDLIISKGVENKLQFDKLRELVDKYPELTIWHLQTNDAIHKYNELINENSTVFAYIHSTC